MLWLSPVGCWISQGPPGSRWHTQIGNCEGSLIQELFTKVWEGGWEPYGALPVQDPWDGSEGWREGQGAETWPAEGYSCSLCCLLPSPKLLPVPPTGEMEGRRPLSSPGTEQGGGERQTEGTCTGARGQRGIPRAAAPLPLGTRGALTNWCALSARHCSRPFQGSNSLTPYNCWRSWYCYLYSQFEETKAGRG